MKLASDDDNTQFIGATNPDARLHKVFSRELVMNEFRSKQEARPIHDTVDFITISVPGNNLFDVKHVVRQEHKDRFPIEWARFHNAQGDGGQITGTPLSQWPQISSAIAEDLKYFRFYTVEQIATASDTQLQSIGMAGGMSAYTLRERAQSFLRLAHGAAEVANREEEFTGIRAENADLKSRLDAMQAQLAELTQKRGPGRPPKDKETEAA